jgi:Ca2+-binding EF-hand superfamily protein
MIDHMIRDADKDKDGFINYSEYAAITQSNKH